MIALIGGEIAAPCEAKCELPPIARIRVITRESPPPAFEDSLVVQNVGGVDQGEFDVCSMETSDTGVELHAECLKIKIEREGGKGKMYVTFKGSDLYDEIADPDLNPRMKLAEVVEYVNKNGTDLKLRFELLDSREAAPAMEADKADSTSVFSLIWQSIFGI